MNPLGRLAEMVVRPVGVDRGRVRLWVTEDLADDQKRQRRLTGGTRLRAGLSIVPGVPAELASAGSLFSRPSALRGSLLDRDHFRFALSGPPIEAPVNPRVLQIPSVDPLPTEVKPLVLRELKAC